MATTEPAGRARTRNRLAVLTVGSLALVGAGALAWSLWPTPQMGADPEVFRTVDALFTAVTARDERRLGACAHRLRGYREAGRLPPDAADALDAIIDRARDGSWQSAAERLYAFMKAQRREDDGERPRAEKKGKRAKGKGRPTAPQARN